LAGLTITGGDISGDPDLEGSGAGGGVNFVALGVSPGESARLTIRDSIITGNQADDRGGGVYMTLGASGEAAHKILLFILVRKTWSPEKRFLDCGGLRLSVTMDYDEWPVFAQQIGSEIILGTPFLRAKFLRSKESLSTLALAA